jgi:glycine cleavage system H protein
MIPEDRTYTRNHEWIKLDEATVQMGVTMPLLTMLGDVIALELPEKEDEMMLDVPFGTLEGTQTLHEMLPPADATVLEVNETLLWDLDTLIGDPYGEGWLIKIKVHTPDQLRSLLAASAYRAHCKELWGEDLEIE